MGVVLLLGVSGGTLPLQVPLARSHAWQTSGCSALLELRGRDTRGVRQILDTDSMERQVRECVVSLGAEITVGASC